MKTNLYRMTCIVFLSIAITIVNLQSLRSEHIFLKDGSILNGTIIKDAATSITVRKADKQIEQVDRTKIMRILYTNLKMGKIHVQMRDGKSFEAYIVDEDQNTYTMRKVLNSPQELIVNRTDVLFIAERNPSGLKGTADTTEIELSWYPPYNPVKHYLLYHKEKNEKNYRPPIKSRGASHTLEELKSNTTYLLKVTAVDDSDDESSPSNELTVTTKNFPPLRPGKAVLKQGPSIDKKKTAGILEWGPSKDPDGTVKEYRVFKDTDEGPVQIGRTTIPVFELPDGMNANGLIIRAVDDRGDESDDRRVFTDSRLRAGVYPAFVLPLGTLHNMFSFGMGVTAEATYTGLLLDGLVLGAETGYFYFFNELEHIDCMHMVPLYFTVKYRFEMFTRFYLEPKISAGFAYMHVRYESSDDWGGEPLSDRTRDSFEPVFKAGIDARYLIMGTVAIGGGVEFGCIYEVSETLTFLSFSIGAEYGF